MTINTAEKMSLRIKTRKGRKEIIINPLIDFHIRLDDKIIFEFKAK